MSRLHPYYRISASLAGLTTGHLHAIGLPEPQTPHFSNFTVRTPQGRGGEGRHGFAWAFLLWDELTSVQAQLVHYLVTTAETASGVGNGTLYATLPKADGSIGGAAWIDISGLVVMPDFRAAPYSGGLLFPNVSLRFNNVTIENEPSTVL